MDNHRSLHPGLSSTRLVFPDTAGSCLQLGGQQWPGVLTVAHDLHLDVSEIWEALVIGGLFPQPDVGRLGAGSNRQWERSKADMSFLPMTPVCLHGGMGPLISQGKFQGDHWTQRTDDEAKAQLGE